MPEVCSKNYDQGAYRGWSGIKGNDAVQRRISQEAVSKLLQFRKDALGSRGDMENSAVSYRDKLGRVRWMLE